MEITYIKNNKTNRRKEKGEMHFNKARPYAYCFADEMQEKTL